MAIRIPYSLTIPTAQIKRPRRHRPVHFLVSGRLEKSGHAGPGECGGSIGGRTLVNHWISFDLPGAKFNGPCRRRLEKARCQAPASPGGRDVEADDRPCVVR